MKAQQIREQYENFKQEAREGWKLKRIADFGQGYIILDTIAPRPGPQNIKVVRLSDCPDDLARFAGAWPEANSWDWTRNVPIRNYALVVFPDEGGVFVMDEDGDSRRVITAVLPIRIESGMREDYQKVKQELDDELSDSDELGYPFKL